MLNRKTNKELKEILIKNKEFLKLNPSEFLEIELKNENKEIYKILKIRAKKRAPRVEQIKEKQEKEIFLNHKLKYFKVSEISEEMEEKETQVWVENYKNNK